MTHTLQENDFCVYKSGNEVKALGWNINSPLLKNDIPIASYNIQSGGKSNNKGGAIIENLAIPAGLILLRNAIESNTNLNDIMGVPEVIGEDLYSKLLNLAGKKKVSHHTRKRTKKVKNKTRKIK